jgi:hypothetical protein
MSEFLAYCNHHPQVQRAEVIVQSADNVRIYLAPKRDFGLNTSFG